MREVQSDVCQVQASKGGVAAVLRAPPQSRCQRGVSDGQRGGSRDLLVFLTNPHASAHSCYHLPFGPWVTDSAEMDDPSHRLRDLASFLCFCEPRIFWLVKAFFFLSWT